MFKIFKVIGLICLICFSFFYTEKVIVVINEQDPLMIKIQEVKDNYKVSSIDATINNNTIIPGIYGKEVNIDRSYDRIKKIGIFNSSLLVYNDIVPSISISRDYAKYIIKGNNNRSEVSLVFILESNDNLEELLKIVDNKNIDINLFIDYNYINSNINNLVNLKKYELYPYNNYTKDKFLFANNIIKRITKSNKLFCLVKEENIDILNICSNNKINTIMPNIITTNPYNDVTCNLTNGSIILMDINSKTINELNSIIDFINSKGKKIVYLSNLLNEKIK